MRVCRCLSIPRIKIVTLRWGCLHAACGRGNASGLDRREAKAAVVGGRDASESRETGLERFVLRVFGMRIAAVRVRLPDFDQRIADAVAVGVDDPALDTNLSPLTARTGKSCDEPVETDVEKRSRRLRCRSSEVIS
jgi:hypothetical protein